MKVTEFTRQVRGAGFECVSALIPQDPYQDVANWRKTERLIGCSMDEWKTPIGVYVGQEVCGRLVVQASHRRGWRIPEDVAIVAGKNEETLCEQPRPPLWSGRRAAVLAPRISLVERHSSRSVEGWPSLPG